MAALPILFCSHVVEWGGAETVLADLFAALDRRRFAPHLACPGPGPLAARAAELGASVHTLPIGGRGALGKALSLPGAALALRALARRIGARVLYANTMIAGYAAVLAQRRDLRCLWHLHVVPRSPIARWMLGRAEAVVAPSLAGARAVAGRRASHRLHVVPNGVAARFFAGASAGAGLRAELGLAPGAPLVGIAGRLDPHKGHAVLFAAAAHAAAQGAPFDVAVIGAEAFAAAMPRVAGHGEALRAAAARLGLAARVHFLGHRDDLADLLPQLDVVAVPSTAPESAPRAIAEAQAAGRAVVASAIGGVPEMVTDGATGRLVSPGDVPALAAAITGLLADPGCRQRLGAAARLHAEHEYRGEHFARRIEAAIEQVFAAASA